MLNSRSKAVVNNAGIYSSSKAALSSISETCRYELRPLGVRTITLNTSAVKTNAFASDQEDILPENSRYSEIRDFIHSISDGRLQDKAISSREYATKVVRGIDQGKVGIIWAGTNAVFIRWATWLAPQSILVSYGLSLLLEIYLIQSTGPDSRKYYSYLCRDDKSSGDEIILRGLRVEWMQEYHTSVTALYCFLLCKLFEEHWNISLPSLYYSNSSSINSLAAVPTFFTFFVNEISFSGFPSTSTKSALLPLAIIPRSFKRNYSAFKLVHAFKAVESPASTKSFSYSWRLSRCLTGAIGVWLASVPVRIGTLARCSWAADTLSGAYFKLEKFLAFGIAFSMISVGTDTRPSSFIIAAASSSGAPIGRDVTISTFPFQATVNALLLVACAMTKFPCLCTSSDKSIYCFLAWPRIINDYFNIVGAFCDTLFNQKTGHFRIVE